MPKAIFPGSFDPLHFGHLDIIQRAAQMFSAVVVAVPTTPSSKPPLFSVPERLELIRMATGHIPTVSVLAYSGLTVQVAHENGCRVMVRGIRALTDFEYEFQLCMMNRHLAPAVETTFLMTDLQYSYVSSTLVKDVAKNGGSLAGLVPEIIAARLADCYRQNTGGS